MISWDDNLITGVYSLDIQHEKIAMMTNNIFLSIQEGASREKKQELIINTKEFINMHVCTEVLLMQYFGYYDFDNHKLSHDMFLRTLSKLEKRFELCQKYATLDIANHLKDWVIKHIHSDKRYTDFLIKRGFC